MDWKIWLHLFLPLNMFYYGFVDKVFGPTTTTRHVYDVAAQHVVNGAMEGVNGKLIFSSYEFWPQCFGSALFVSGIA